MTRPTQKMRERFLAEQAAKFLSVIWSLGQDREHPDFIVDEGAQQFGLEVCEIFTGIKSCAGSIMKKNESNTQQAVDALRREYEATADIPLRVQFVGNMCPENMAMVVPALLAKDFSSKPIRHHDVIDEDNGLRVHVTKALRPEWFSINDRAGWVDRKAIQRIAGEIEKKSEKLPTYIDAAGPDIRLLIVANRIHNSGKLIIEERSALNLRGFRVVYFFSYPESVTVFD